MLLCQVFVSRTEQYIIGDQQILCFFFFFKDLSGQGWNGMKLEEVEIGDVQKQTRNSTSSWLAQNICLHLFTNLFTSLRYSEV